MAHSRFALGDEGGEAAGCTGFTETAANGFGNGVGCRGGSSGGKVVAGSELEALDAGLVAGLEEVATSDVVGLLSSDEGALRPADPATPLAIARSSAVADREPAAERGDSLPLLEPMDADKLPLGGARPPCRP